MSEREIQIRRMLVGGKIEGEREKRREEDAKMAEVNIMEIKGAKENREKGSESDSLYLSFCKRVRSKFEERKRRESVKKDDEE